MKLSHVRLLVDNYRECFRFYRDVMGFEVTWGKEDEDYADFNAGTTTIALFTRKFMSDALGTTGKPNHVDAQDRMALIFGVASVDETYARLKAQSVEFLTLPTDRADWGIRLAHFRDPDGNLIEITSSLAG